MNAKLFLMALTIFELIPPNHMRPTLVQDHGLVVLSGYSKETTF